MNGKKLAIITARGGSKRIPRKNIKDFCGKPILCYSIEAAFASGAFDEVMVSTDDAEIAEIARSTGASVPFFRSAEMSGDYASTDDVIMEVLKEYEKSGLFFEAFCCIYPTAPFLTGKRLKDAMELLETADSVMPVVPFSYPPQRGLIVNDKGFVERQFPEYFMKAGTTDVEKLVPLVLSEMEVQDIDTPEDWEIAEIKYKRLNHGKAESNYES